MWCCERDFKTIFPLTLSVADNEFQYINEENAVTLPLAYSLGFKDVNEKTYISPTVVGMASGQSADTVVNF